jgi:peptidoglycan/LPS O-acetylase OafA/YrhL
MLPPDHQIRYGYLGVDMFFILSGFVISHVHASEFQTLASLRRAFAFYGLRLARIYPVHLITLFCLLAVSVTAIALHRYTLDKLRSRDISFVVNLFLLQGWWKQPLSWNYPSWSVSCEWFAYLLFPLFACALMQMRRIFLVIACVIDLAIFVWAYEHCMWYTLDWNNGLPALLRLVCEFALGGLLWKATLYFNIAGRSASIAAALLAVIAAVGYFGESSFFELLTVVTFAAVIVAGSRHDNWVSRVLAVRPLVYLGEISYSIYMWHAVIGGTVCDVIEVRLKHMPLELRCGFSLFLLGLTIATAAASYHWVETPVRSWYRDRLRKAAAARASAIAI